MSEKHYQISPIELVQWAEPLFSFGEGKATGFSEKKIAAYEAAAGIRLPAALREYYLACGKASLNCALHEIFVPDKKAKLFEKRLTFSYDHIDYDLETFSKPGEEDYPELAKIRALPRERWGFASPTPSPADASATPAWTRKATPCMSMARRHRAVPPI